MQAYSLRLSKGVRNRITEDLIASRLLLKALGEACGLRQEAEQLSLHLQPKENGLAPSDHPTEVVEVLPKSPTLLVTRILSLLTTIHQAFF